MAPAIDECEVIPTEGEPPDNGTTDDDDAASAGIADAIDALRALNDVLHAIHGLDMVALQRDFDVVVAYWRHMSQRAGKSDVLKPEKISSTMSTRRATLIRGVSS